MPDLDRDDITLHYEIDGAGPPVILLAGMLSDSASWTPLVEPLSREFTLIRPDNRTTGRTTPWDAPVSILGMAQDALALMDHLGHGAFHVVGHSMGGRMAIELAGLAAGRVSSLTVMASAPQRSARSIAVFDALSEIRAQPDGETLWLKALYPWVFSSAFFENPENTEIALQAALAYPHAQSRAAMMHQIDILRTYVPQADISDLTCPTQVLYGEKDVLLPEDEARAGFAAFANATHHTIAGAGHSIHWDASKAVTAQLLGFLGSHRT